MPLEDPVAVEIRIAQPDRCEPCRLLVVERRCGRGNEVRLDRDEVVDQLGARDLIVEGHAHDVVALDAGLHADRGAGAGERVDEIAARRGIGIDDGSDDDHAARTLRMTDAQVRRARVMAVGRNAVWVLHDDEPEPVLAALRKNDRRLVLAPGDLVSVRRLDDDHVVVDAVEPRGFALVRTTAGGRTKTMAANIDAIMIVAALADPPPSLTMIDQLIAFAVQHGVEAALILTKPDLVDGAEVERIAGIYAPLGVPVLIVGAKAGEGIEALRTFLRGRAALLVGNSGVGKSTIFRALGGTATVGELSRFGRGRQTTTSARLYRSEGGFLIDSPGIGEFTLDPVPPDELTALFVEMREPAERCRFDDCRHLVEPDCAVRAAVAAGSISPSRYASYRAIARGDPPR